jgi:hypothetical protein
MQLHDLQPYTPIVVAVFGLVGIIISKNNGAKLDQVKVNVDGNLSKALQEISDLKAQVNLLLQALNKDKSPKEQEGWKAF